MNALNRMPACCVVATLLVVFATSRPVVAAFKAKAPGPVPAGAVAVEGPGSYDKAGTTYVLTKAVSYTHLRAHET